VGNKLGQRLHVVSIGDICDPRPNLAALPLQLLLSALQGIGLDVDQHQFHAQFSATSRAGQSKPGCASGEDGHFACKVVDHLVTSKESNQLLAKVFAFE
jgi:hypothetical protein